MEKTSNNQQASAKRGQGRAIKKLYRVRIIPGLQYDCTGDATFGFEEGSDVVVSCQGYRDFGVVTNTDGKTGPVEELEQFAQRSGKGRRIEGQGLPRIVRKASATDRERARENAEHAQQMHKTAIKKLDQHGLAMKIVNTHLSFDGKFLFLQFRAEEKVDFREFLNDLSRTCGCKVELRQIGVRDEAALQGGMGICGRPFCCVSFLRKFENINVKMAKSQNLSLNPSTSSGACGRLKCCLRFEHEGYKEMQQDFPSPGTLCETSRGRGVVKDVHFLKGKIWVALDNEDHQVAEFTKDEVSVLRE